MAEVYKVTGPPRGEPLRAGRVGARVRIPLSGTPSPRWSRVFTARLGTSLVGHPAVGHLELGGLVQGADVVLEGVEPKEAERLGPSLLAAVEAANRDSGQHPAGEGDWKPNMSQKDADAIARLIRLDIDS